MQYRPDPAIIVIVGAWNQAIFNPDWISKFIFDGEKIEINIDVNQSIPRFTYKNITLFLNENRLIIIGKNVDKDTLDSMESITLKIADFLPHTPTLALGINFKLSSTEIGGFDKWFEEDDLTVITGMNYELESTQVKKTFKKGNFKYNISLTQNNKKEILIDINYEFQVKTLIDVKQNISPGFYFSTKKEVEAHVIGLFGEQLNSIN